MMLVNILLGGQLSVHDITDPSISYLNIGSGDVVDVFPDHAFNAETMIQDANTYDLSTGNFLGVFSHLNWNRHSSEFRLSKHYPDLSEEFWAFFKIKDPINFQSSGGDHVEIMIQDPWYVRNDGNKTQTGTDWVSVDDEEIGSKFFLNQIPDGSNANKPHYTLRAPRYSADVNGIYEFSGWTVSNQTEGPDAGEPAAAFGDATTRTTTAVFKEASAEITANYNTANPVNLAGAEMYIGSNDQLVIPAGAQIPFASGVRINCLGSISIQGTEEAPINLYGYEGQRWEGIELPIEGTIFYCDISNTNTALTLTNDAHDACLIEFTYLNIDDAFIGIDNRYNWVNDGVIEQVNVINSSFTNIHQSAILDDVGNLNEWMISGCSFVGNETYPDAKGFYVEHTNDWTEYSHIFNKIEIRDNDFSSYASAIHIDGLVYWDWLSEYPEINKIEISTNTISNCQNAGIWISGEYNLFSHHNVIQNCGKGFYLNHVDDYSGAPNDVYRIANETFVSNTIGFDTDVIYLGTPGNPYLKNTDVKACIFYGNDRGVWDDSYTNVQGNIFYQFENASSGLTGNETDLNMTSTDPLFVNFASGDFHLEIGSPAIDQGLEDFNNNGTDWDGPDNEVNTSDDDLEDQDPDRTRMDMGAYYYPQLSGNFDEDMVITTSATFSGNLTLNGDLRIMQGARVTVAEGVRLDIQGNFTVLGTSSSPVLMGPEAGSDHTWEGIYVHGGEVDVNGLEVFGSSRVGLGLGQGSSGSVRNSSFHDNVVGLRLYNTDPGLVIESNDISNNSSLGLNIRSSSPIVTNNTISGNGDIGVNLLSGSGASLKNNKISDNGLSSSSPHAGGVCIIHASPDFSIGYDLSHVELIGYPVNNDIFDNANQGVYVSFTAAPHFGLYSEESDWLYGGFNHFYGNEFSINRNGIMYDTDDQINYPDLLLHTLNAEANYWYETLSDGAQPTNTNGRSINTDFTAPNVINLGGSDQTAGIWLKEAQILEEKGELEQALVLYDESVLLSTDDKEIKIAVSSISRIYDKLGLKEEKIEKLEEYLSKEELSTLSKTAGMELVWAYKKAGLDTKAIELIEELIEGETDEQNQAAYTLELALLTEELGGTFLYKRAYQSDVEKKTQNAGEQLLTTFAKTEAAEVYALLTGKSVQVAVIPKQFALHSVYPNPFNPSVTIPYTLPEIADVSITIYDILGRQVWSHEVTSKPPGAYKLQWDGLNARGKLAASGVYLISFSTPKYSAVQKAVLIR